MKTLQKTLIALAAGTLMTAGAQAAINYDNMMNGQAYIGAKAGKFMIDVDGIDDPTAYGIYGGYNFDPSFGVEVEYMTSSDADVDVEVGEAEANNNTFGAYGTYRYHFPTMSGLYAKGKLGFAKNEVEITSKVAGVSRTVTGDDTGLAGGVGLGYSISPNMNVEGEFAMVESDTNMVTLGAQFKF